MKKNLYLYTLCILTIFALPVYAQNEEPSFFTTLHDVPLMDGLIEIEDNATSYDKPNGRIIDVFATINMRTTEDIITYYNAILPQFGWGKTENGTFYRDQEILELTFEKRENIKILKISIRPSL